MSSSNYLSGKRSQKLKICWCTCSLLWHVEYAILFDSDLLINQYLYKHIEMSFIKAKSSKFLNCAEITECDPEPAWPSSHPHNHQRNLANNNGGEGVSKSTVGNTNFNLTSQKVEQDWLEPVLNIQTPLSLSPTPVFLFFPLKLSSQKNYSRVEKILEGNFGSSYQVLPMLTTFLNFFLISLLIMSFQFLLSPQNVCFPAGFSTKSLYAFLVFTIWTIYSAYCNHLCLTL
jgi:hypothetical protein